MSKRIGWSQEEAAVLFHAMLMVHEGCIKRSVAVAKVSRKLRRLAIINGIVIDDKFRNTNGVSMQMSSLEYIYTKGKTGLFKETSWGRQVIEMYNTAPNKYRKLLATVLEKIDCCKMDVSKESNEFVHESSNVTSYGNDDIVQKLLPVLQESFLNGIRPASIIDLNRIRMAYQKYYPGKSLADGFDITAMVQKYGICFQGKYYFLSKTDNRVILEILNTCEIQGYTIFYYGNFFEKFRVLLTEHHVFSPEMLRIVLQSIAPDYLYAKAYFTISETGTSEQEIRKYFACNEQGMLVQDLIGRLPFIPEDVIRSALHQNDYTWVREGVYVWNEQILLDEDEVKRVKGRVIHDIELNGFAVLTNYDFPESFDNCLQLSMSAVRNAFYKSALQESFERSGNLLLPKGKKISIVTMMEEFCTKHEIVDKAELIALEQDLTGNNIHRAIEVACQKMMRVSKDRFIQKNAILFDVMKVDQCLDAYVRNRVIPLQAVKSFTGFPLPSNYIWNLFLLESFCRHVSKKYRFQCASPNDRNLGAIYPAALQLENYIDVLARAVFEAKIPITEEEVANYLIEQGFLSRKTATIKKVINKAQQLNGKGD